MSWLSHELRTSSWRFRQKYLLNFTFVHIPKSAGTSITRALGIVAEQEHKTAMELRGRIGADRWEKKFVFAFVRNPWDRAVSSFHFAVTRNKPSRFVGLTFSEWLQIAYVDRHPLYFDLPHPFLPQFDWISDSRDNVLVDFVGRFENLQQDFDVVCERIGRPVVVLPHSNPTKHEDYRHYYKDKDVDVIAHWYKKDIEHFGYTFDRPTSIPLLFERTRSAKAALKQVAV